MTVDGADAVYRGGKVVTVDSRFRIAEAFAVSGNRFLRVGSNADMQNLIGPRTRVVPLNGRAVLPGLIDAHAHMDREGLRSVFPSLGKVRSIADIQQRVAELARNAKPGEWIATMPIGDPPLYDNVPGILAEKRFPTRQELDEAAPHNPVLIRPIWGYWRHTPPLVSCANSEALRRAGITRDTVPPVDMIRIEKDERTGEPTGVIYEQTMQSAVELVYFRAAPGFSRQDRVRALPVSQAAYHAVGTTSVVEGHGAAMELVRAYRDIKREGKLTMRTMLAFSPNWKAMDLAKLEAFAEAWLSLVDSSGLGDDLLRINGIFVDANFATADNELRAQVSPYTGWAGFNYNTGLPREQTKRLLLECARNDIRPFGILAPTPVLLSLYEEVDREIPIAGRRWSIAHFSSLTKKEIETIARLGLAVSTHTNSYVYKLGGALRDRLGPKREDEACPIRSLLDAGVPVAFATDNVPISLFSPIWQAVSRQARDGSKVAPKQAISREAAIRCATINGAWVTFDEDKKGSIEAGKLADFTILDRDPLTVPEDQLRDITAIATFVDGNKVHGHV